MIPFVRIIMNIIKNDIVDIDHGINTGIATIKAISMSKIMNSTINKKNRMENGFRGDEHRLIPHSNDEFLLDHFFISFLRYIGRASIILIMNKVIR